MENNRNTLGLSLFQLNLNGDSKLIGLLHSTSVELVTECLMQVATVESLFKMLSVHLNPYSGNFSSPRNCIVTEQYPRLSFHPFNYVGAGYEFEDIRYGFALHVD